MPSARRSGLLADGLDKMELAPATLLGLALGQDRLFGPIEANLVFDDFAQRNVGSASPLKLPRGVNALWNKGGLMYAPPIR